MFDVNVGAVLMASGLAARFGANKLLREVEGVPMIQRAFGALPADLFARAAVVSACPGILTWAEERGYRPIYNPRAIEGQSVSLRLGLTELLDMDGVLFAVCDQPWLRRESVERLLEEFSLHLDRVCALGWNGRRGSPVIFPASLFPELMALTGDRGGSQIIRSRSDLLRIVEVEDPKELRDVDRPEDLN